MVGTALLAPADLLALQETSFQLAEKLGTDKEDETYWELVKSQFLLEKGLHYFNNGSLGTGTSPEYVFQATEQFRRTLDGFPSQYMWGAWDDQKEAVRDKAGERMTDL